MRTQARAVFTVVAVLAGSGASPSFASQSLKKEAVKEIRVQLMEPGICPGGEIKFSVTAVLANGTEAVTKGVGKGKVGWDNNYRVTFDGGKTDDDKIKMNADPRITWSGPPALRITAIDHTDITWNGTVPVRYDCAESADVSGHSGSSGSRGSDGSNGSRAGDSGDNGRDGGNGDFGEHGPRVEVYVTTTKGAGAETLVQAAVESHGERRYFAIQPNGGSLTVHANGGKGGDGGAGGDGGRGGKGSGGEREGRGGDGAVGGCGGDGGDGGDVVLHLDPKARAYRDLINVRNEGGSRGSGGLYGSGGKGSPKGRDGRTGCEGRAGHDGDLRTVEEKVAPLW
jgi:hypothetical protein